MTTMNTDAKAKNALKGRKPGFSKYREIQYGDVSSTFAIRAECLFSILGPMPGAAGLFLRGKFYPSLLGACGKNVVFGRNLTLRHPRKIRLGNDLIIDDNVVLDAKGASNKGITVGDSVFIGRNTIVYCKNGDIVLEHAVNISSNCQIFSSNRVVIGAQSVIAAFTYILSGGQYDPDDKTTPFADQSGMITRGPTTVGANCWLAAKVVIVDGVTVGNHCVIGAGSVVMKDIPPDSLAVGTPAKVVRSI